MRNSLSFLFVLSLTVDALAASLEGVPRPVSYTHLTLPTIYSV